MRFLVATALASTVLAGAGLASASTPERKQALIDTTVGYLQNTQQSDGGFAEPGTEESPDISSWVAQALEGAGINPQDQSRCGTDAYTYLVDHFQEGIEEELAWPLTATTALERELMVVDGAGTDPHDFAGHDLVAEILDRRLADGSFPHIAEGTEGGSNDTIFAILALSPFHEPAIEAVIDQAAEWVVGAEDEDGGWYYSAKSAASEVDMTGAALQALIAAGPPASEPQLAAYHAAIEGGLAYLHRAQLPDGGFPFRPAGPEGEGESNVASTAWAVQGIWATGGNPEEWTVGPEAREPLDYMESMQQPDGHIRWRASTDLNGIWMTAYVTPAFAGQTMPPPDAARSSGLASHGEAAGCDEAGQGGQSPRPGEGVDTAGDGHRAPAFSRPKTQSDGRTPGGARLVRGQALKARDHSADRRGANLHQARGTETEEPRSAAEADQEVESVTAGAAGPAVASSGGGGDDGPGTAERGAPLPAEGSPGAAATTGGEEVDGVVIGAPAGSEAGALAFGAPGLRSAGAGSGEGSGVAIAIGAAVLVALGLGVGWERRRGVLA